MEKSVKFEEGMLSIKVSESLDSDKDGKASGVFALDIQLDAAEVISEVAKKDLPWLEALVKSIKI